MEVLEASSLPELVRRDRASWVDGATEPCIVVGGLRRSTSALSFALASSSPCFMCFYMLRKNQKGAEYKQKGIPELEPMSRSLFQLQPFPSSLVSDKDISSQRAAPVNQSVKKRASVNG